MWAWSMAAVLVSAVKGTRGGARAGAQSRQEGLVWAAVRRPTLCPRDAHVCGAGGGRAAAQLGLARPWVTPPRRVFCLRTARRVQAPLLAGRPVRVLLQAGIRGAATARLPLPAPSGRLLQAACTRLLTRRASGEGCTRLWLRRCARWPPTPRPRCARLGHCRGVSWAQHTFAQCSTAKVHTAMTPASLMPLDAAMDAAAPALPPAPVPAFAPLCRRSSGMKRRRARLLAARAVQVAAAGLAALRAANVELIHVPGGATSAAPSRAASAAPSRAASAVPSTAGSSGLPVSVAAAGAAASGPVGASGGGVSTLLPKSWQPKSWRTSGGGGGGSAVIGGSNSTRHVSGAQSLNSSASGSLGSGVGSAAGSPNPSPVSATYTRQPFVLRRVGGMSGFINLGRVASPLCWQGCACGQDCIAQGVHLQGATNAGRHGSVSCVSQRPCVRPPPTHPTTPLHRHHTTHGTFLCPNNCCASHGVFSLQAPDAGDSAHSFAAAVAATAAAAGAYDLQQRPLSAQGSTASLDGASAFAGVAGVASHPLAAALPQSGIYASSCRAFTWPLLAPQSQVRLPASAWAGTV